MLRVGAGGTRTRESNGRGRYLNYQLSGCSGAGLEIALLALVTFPFHRRRECRTYSTRSIVALVRAASWFFTRVFLFLAFSFESREHRS